MKAIKVRIHLDEPLLITGVANGEPNSSTTLDYIPGSALRGVCVAAFLQQHPDQRDLVAPDSPARSLFFEEKVLFLNGYPAHSHYRSTRALPVPLSWHAEKGELRLKNHNVWDFAVEPLTEAEAPPQNPKRVEKRYFWQTDEEVKPLFSPPHHVTAHNASDRPMIKAPDNSTVFRYDALAAGQDFVAFVLGENDELLEEVRRCLPDGPLRLGGSQTAGYGLVTVTTEAPAAWQWDRGEAQLEDLEEYTIVTLVSDAILRTTEGEPTTDFPAVLGTILDKPCSWKPERIFARAQLVGGFNRKWGLPLPQSWAVARGSTFVYRTDSLPIQELRSLVERGIGERRNEGFGRLGVNLSTVGYFQTGSPNSPIPTRVSLAPESQNLARQMAQRRLWNAVQAEIPNYLKKVSFEGRRPENTQLSRMRRVVREAQRQRATAGIIEHLSQLRRAREQFEQRFLKVDGETISWSRWLQARATEQDALDLFELNPAAPQWQIAGESVIAEAEALANLRAEATYLLMDALLRKAVRMEE